MKKQEILTEVEALVRPIAEENGYELVDVEYVKEGKEWYLRIYADKEGGFSINDCVTLSRAVDQVLEEKDPIENAYHLEVSSPGLDRPLKKNKDFVRNLNKLIEVRFYAPKEECGGERECTALLKAYDADRKEMTLELENRAQVAVAVKDTALIRQAVIF